MKKSELIAQLQTEIAAYGDGEVSEVTLQLIQPLDEATQQARGKLLADVLKLKKDTEHKDRYQMGEWGTKTAIGVFATVRRIIDEGE